MLLDKIRECCKKNNIIWTPHAITRMMERGLTKNDVMSCIYEGKIIENYPDDFPYPSCLIYGHAINLRVIHVVIGSDREYIFVITAYEPDAIRFEDDLKTRKEIK